MSVLRDAKTFSSYSVDDIDTAYQFYYQTLGLDCEQTAMGLQLHVAGGNEVFIYPKPNHEPASHTVLNFVVEDIDAAVTELSEHGVTFERYDGMEFDDKGIARTNSPEQGPDIAWFKDPAGNTLAVLHPKS